MDENIVPPTVNPPEQTPSAQTPVEIQQPQSKKGISTRTSALIIGSEVLVLALLITAVILLPGQSKSPATLETAPSAASPQKAAFDMQLDQPVDGQLLDNAEAVISGTTAPNTTVVYYTDQNEGAVDSDAAGKFQGKLKMADGINTVTVFAAGNNGEEKTITMDLVVDTQVLGVSTDKNLTNRAANRSVVGKVEKVTLKDITVKDKNNKDNLVNVDQKTKILNEKNKLLKLNSLKPNDKAMIVTDLESATNPGKLKKALKIYVKQASGSGELAESKRQAVQGVIANIAGNTITLTHQTQRDRTFTVTLTAQTVIKIKGTTTATKTDLQVGQRIIVVGDKGTAGALTAKWIHVIPGKATGVFNNNPITPQPTGASVSGTPTITITPAATGSATPTVTTTATPTVTPSATPTVSPTEVPPTATPTP